MKYLGKFKNQNQKYSSLHLEWKSRKYLFSGD